MGAEPEVAPRTRVRTALTAATMLAGLALAALLAYGLIARSPNTGIDDSLAEGRPIAAPGFRLAVLRRGDLGEPLGRKLAPVLADGWVSPSELRGTPYLLNIWASWCVPCREEAPLLAREWRRARPRGFLFVGLDMQDAIEDARAFMDQFGIDYLNIRDPSNATMRRYGATGIPETYFVNARGEVVNHVVGVVSREQLRAGVAAAIAGRPRQAQRGGDQRPAR